MSHNQKVVVIDDDRKLCELLVRFLAGRGYRVSFAGDGAAGVRLLETENPDLILLDVMLPGEDGFDVLKRIRRISNVPVLMLTARGDTGDRVLGLELGADDYIPKPFDPPEIAARIKAVLRRHEQSMKGGDDPVFRFSGFTVNGVRKCLEIDGNEVELSLTEYRLLEYFVRNRSRVLSRDQITEALHGDAFESFNRSVDILISRLRRKLNDDPKKPEIIKTVHGHGYMFIAE